MSEEKNIEQLYEENSDGMFDDNDINDDLDDDLDDEYSIYNDYEDKPTYQRMNKQGGLRKMKQL